MCANAKLESKALDVAARNSKPPIFPVKSAGARRTREREMAIPSAKQRGFLRFCSITGHLPCCSRKPRVGLQSLITSHSALPLLPGTVTRVEMHLTHRKQTTAHALTRNVPAHASARISGWQLGVTRRKSSCARRRAVCYSEGVPPSGLRATAPARPSKQRRPSPAYFLLSRRLLAPAPLAGATRERPSGRNRAPSSHIPKSATAFLGSGASYSRARVDRNRETSCAF